MLAHLISLADMTLVPGPLAPAIFLWTKLSMFIKASLLSEAMNTN